MQEEVLSLRNPDGSFRESWHFPGNLNCQGMAAHARQHPADDYARVSAEEIPFEQHMCSFCAKTVAWESRGMERADYRGFTMGDYLDYLTRPVRPVYPAIAASPPPTRRRGADALDHRMPGSFESGKRR
jgi:hypothetical protein